MYHVHVCMMHAHIYSVLVFCRSEVDQCYRRIHHTQHTAFIIWFTVCGRACMCIVCVGWPDCCYKFQFLAFIHLNLHFEVLSALSSIHSQWCTFRGVEGLEMGWEWRWHTHITRTCINRQQIDYWLSRFENFTCLWLPWCGPCAISLSGIVDSVPFDAADSPPAIYMCSFYSYLCALAIYN